MYLKVISFIKNNKYAQFALVFLLGGVIGVVFYPTKRIQEKFQVHEQEVVKQLTAQHVQELSTEHDKLTKLTEEYSSYKADMQQKVSSLTVQVEDLSSHKRVTFRRIIHADGSSEEFKTFETRIEESNKIIEQLKQDSETKVSSLNQQWEKTVADKVAAAKKESETQQATLQARISELERDKTISSNPKKFGVEAGILLSKSYYLHGTYDLFGPIFVGAHIESGISSGIAGGTVGVGAGIRF